jgi:hypothetical protein
MQGHPGDAVPFFEEDRLVVGHVRSIPAPFLARPGQRRPHDAEGPALHGRALTSKRDSGRLQGEGSVRHQADRASGEVDTGTVLDDEPFLTYVPVPPVTVPTTSYSLAGALQPVPVCLNVVLMVVVFLLGAQVMVPVPLASAEVGALALTYCELAGEQDEIRNLVVIVPPTFLQDTPAA